MKCFHELCPNPAAYTFHSGGLCVVHAGEARQNAPQLVLTALPPDEAKTDPNTGDHSHDERAETRVVGSVYPNDKPGE